MRRRKKSKKGKSKSKFPQELTIYGCPSRKESRIITDAGFESIDYQLALQYFSLEEIVNYWELTSDFLSRESEEEIEKFEELVSANYSGFSEAKQKEFVELIMRQFSGIPTLLDVATARAVYNLEHRWIKILALLKRTEIELYIDSYETEAIRLGLALKKELNDLNLAVINDNKHAVSSINGIISFDPRFLKDFREFIKENKPEVFWSPRKFVNQADRLSIHEATRIFTPDSDFDDYLNSEY